jgi:hypothetical protein
MVYLLPSERIALLTIFALVAYAFAAPLLGAARVDWVSFVGSIHFYGLIALLGMGLRLCKILPHIAAMLVVIGLLPIFATIQSIATMLHFPLSRPLIDETLFAIDAWLGYDWARSVTWLADYPALSKVLGQVYLSSFGQILCVIVFLGLTKRVARLEQLLLVTVLSALITLGFWLIWPSFGPSAYLTLPDDVIAVTGLVVTPDYGAVLNHFALNGFDVIASHLVLGTVAFPSYHMVMAIIVVWCTRGTWAFWPALALNIPMIPATLTHGGHHLIDLAGGGAAFGLAVALAAWLGAERSAPPVLQTARA